MKIALFGGSFNPIHEGHLTIAAAACRQYRFDRFFFVPAARSPFKQNETPISASLRIEMIRAALRMRCGFPFEVCTWETEQGGVSYSIDTVHYIKSLYPATQIVWIGGEDLLSGLSLWKDADCLRQEVLFLIFRRNTDAGSPVIPAGFTVDFLDIPPIPYSSSGIRSRLKSGIPVGAVAGLPPAVAAIIEREGLYR